MLSGRCRGWSRDVGSGCPNPLLLGLIAFFMEFVPVVGVIISGGVGVLVALFVGPITAVLALAYFVLIQVLEGDVVGPRIMGNALGIHPALALIAFIVGSELFGIWGALFGVSCSMCGRMSR